MTQNNNLPRVFAVLTVIAALSACNSPMPPDANASTARGVLPPEQREPSGADAHGAQEAIRTLAAPPVKPLTPNPDYARFPRYVGTLAGQQIEMKLGAKTGPDEDPSGVHGEYQIAGQPAVILVAGDRDGDTLEIEESNDGTHITGNWIGQFAADGSVTGERMNPDDSDPQPFELHPAVPGKTLPAASNVPKKAPPAPSLEPAPPKNSVGGTSNVIIGE